VLGEKRKERGNPFLAARVLSLASSLLASSQAYWPPGRYYVVVDCCLLLCSIVVCRLGRYFILEGGILLTCA
jgi:hypothetical protein